ncbi:MAG: type II toxin-antitoxin system VapC family toxin [Terracidiphilus sp.]|jgi:predicted nucleic acid-binding protein
MPNNPSLDVWDSCCIIGVLNGEKDKVPALLAQMSKYESGYAVLGVPNGVISEVVALADGSSAAEPLKQFLANSYIQTLTPTVEVSILSGQLQHRFDSKRMPDLREKAIAAGCPKDQAIRLRSKDADILATALHYKAARLITYDPFLRFLGQQFIATETGLVIDIPQSSFLPLDFPVQKVTMS